MLRPPLCTAPYITVYYTHARHARQNLFCTQIGNYLFTSFPTLASKSLLNFLYLLRASHTYYVINDAPLSYMRGPSLALPVISQFAAQPHAHFANQLPSQTHLYPLLISALHFTPDPVQIATERALCRSIHTHFFLRNTVFFSDDARQFHLRPHALCFIHSERFVHKLHTFTELHRNSQQRFRSLISSFYAHLKTYCAAPTVPRRAEMRALFYLIFCPLTPFATLYRLLLPLHSNKAELLPVLETP